MGKTGPNILWIGVDKLHIKTLGVYGSINCRTPNLDRFSGGSLVFDNAFCPTAVCAPTRASMLTGRLPSEGSVICNDLVDWTLPTRDTSRKRRLDTWAETLHSSNYRSVHIGKWHLTGDDGDRPGDYGFEGTDYGGFGRHWRAPIPVHLSAATALAYCMHCARGHPCRRP